MVVRIEKVLEGANIKLTSVASHVLSMSSRAMLDELIAGNQDAEAMAELARSNMRSKRAQLTEALVGNFGEHQKFMLESHLRLIDQLDAEIESLNVKIEERMRPFQAQIDLIDEIPGIGRRSAEKVLAEIGVDMSRFRSAAHLASWPASAQA